MYCPVSRNATRTNAPKTMCRSFIVGTMNAERGTMNFRSSQWPEVSGQFEDSDWPPATDHWLLLKPVVYAAPQRLVLDINVLKSERNVGVEVERGALPREEFHGAGGRG